MTSVTYSIPNISCGHCVNTIQMEVSEMDGVESVVASADSKQVEITFDAPANEEGIKALLTEINYPVADLLSLQIQRQVRLGLNLYCAIRLTHPRLRDAYCVFYL